jgi:transcriptional regulator with XRE-family HTH domain
MDLIQLREESANTIRQQYFSTQLRVIRNDRKLSQEELAKKAGVPLRVIQLCEDPKGDIGELILPQLQRIAGALDIPLRVSFEPYSTLPEDVMALMRPELLNRIPGAEEFPKASSHVALRKRLKRLAMRRNPGWQLFWKNGRMYMHKPGIRPHQVPNVQPVQKPKP